MRTIFALALRQVVILVVSFFVLYVVVLSFGGNYNYFSWHEGEKGLFGFAVLLSSILLHAYWYHLKEEGKLDY